MHTYLFLTLITAIAIFNGWMGNNVWSFVALGLTVIVCMIDVRMERAEAEGITVANVCKHCGTYTVQSAFSLTPATIDQFVDKHKDCQPQQPRGIEYLNGTPFIQFDGDGNILQKGILNGPKENILKP